MMMTNEQAANWLIATLAGHTGGEPLGEDEIQSVELGEVYGVRMNTQFVYGVRMNTQFENNQIVIALPEELPGGTVQKARFLITVSRVVSRIA
jgi:hypothetical protein